MFFERSQSSDFIGHRQSRPRPATTGRYFDRSNGVCTSVTARMSMEARPGSSWRDNRLDPPCPESGTSRPFSGKPRPPGIVANPGLRIQQMRLNIKENAMIRGF